MIPYLMCFILFLTGLYGVITRRNLIKIAISMSIMEVSIFLFFALIGYVDNGKAPIVNPAEPDQIYVDPLPQALVLTAIVIGFALLCFSLVLVVRLMRAAGTDDAHRLRAAEPPHDDGLKPPLEDG